MPHIQVKIDSLLPMRKEKLQKMFGLVGNVKEVLRKAKKNGDVYVSTEGCENFDLKEGCLCK